MYIAFQEQEAMIHTKLWDNLMFKLLNLKVFIDFMRKSKFHSLKSSLFRNFNFLHCSNS